jgi:hypothetical protein
MGLAPLVLVRARSLWRSPRLAVLLWQGAVAGVLTALVMLLVVALLPTRAVSLDRDHLVHACPMPALPWYDPSQLSVFRIVGAAIAVLTLTRLGWATIARCRHLRTTRRSQRALLDVLAGHDPDGTHLLTSDVRAAYCIPGGRGRIVLTTAADVQLTPAQCTAVIEHDVLHDGPYPAVVVRRDACGRCRGRPHRSRPCCGSAGGTRHAATAARQRGRSERPHRRPTCRSPAPGASPGWAGPAYGGGRVRCRAAVAAVGVRVRTRLGRERWPVPGLSDRSRGGSTVRLRA